MKAAQLEIVKTVVLPTFLLNTDGSSTGDFINKAHLYEHDQINELMATGYSIKSMNYSVVGDKHLMITFFLSAVR